MFRTEDRRGMLRGADAVAVAHRHGLPVITIGALAEDLPYPAAKRDRMGLLLELAPAAVSA